MASSSNSSTTTSSSYSFTPYTATATTAGQPRKRLRLTQTSTEGLVEWTLDLHVASGAHVTCMPSGPHLLIEEVDNEEEPRRIVSSTLVRCIEDGSKSTPGIYPFDAGTTPTTATPSHQLTPKAEPTAKRNLSEDGSEEDKSSRAAFIRALKKQERDISPRDLLREALFPPPDPSQWPSQPLMVPRVIREKLHSLSVNDGATPSDIASPSTKAGSSSSYSSIGSSWTGGSVWGVDQPQRTVLVQPSRPIRSPAVGVKKGWTPKLSKLTKEEGQQKIRTPRPVNSEAAPKSRVHFTADGSIPVCRMPNCRRPMYFYKNEDRWRCNLNRGGCGAVFYNVGRDIGPCSKCQRPVGESHPCQDWCVCRYCTSSKKHLDSPPPAAEQSNQSEWTASSPPTS